MQIVLSIIIPTHNRANDLLENLASLLPQCRGKPVEIIVVDSASDTAKATALDVLRGVDQVQLIRLDRPGVSIARNAGVAQANGVWLGFLDDDVVVAADWLDRTLARIASSGDQVGVVAGRVLPRWPTARSKRMFEPSRLGPRSRMLLSIISDTRVYCSSAAPLGISANLLIRSDALHQVHGFPEHMGRVGMSLASGEDPYVIDEIVKCGFESWYDGSICVEHKIYANQLTHRWMARRAWHEGIVNLRKCESRLLRAVVAAKSTVSLPALGLLRMVSSSHAEYVVRLHHNLGFVCSAMADCFRWTNALKGWNRAIRNRAPALPRLGGAARPLPAEAYPRDDADE